MINYTRFYPNHDSSHSLLPESCIIQMWIKYYQANLLTSRLINFPKPYSQIILHHPVTSNRQNQWSKGVIKNCSKNSKKKYLINIMRLVFDSFKRENSLLTDISYEILRYFLKTTAAYLETCQTSRRSIFRENS